MSIFRRSRGAARSRPGDRTSIASTIGAGQIVAAVAGWQVPLIGAIPRTILLDQRLTLGAIPWGALTDLLPAAHLTCGSASRGEIDEIVDRYHEVGVRHIVALRGDPPGGIGTPYFTHPDGYQSSAELVAGIKRRHADIEISVSAYPEKHPEAKDFDADIDTLKAKVDAGATRAITQVFFDNDLYHRYVDRVRARGIEIPVVPGIMPMHNFKQARNFVTRAGTSVPDWLAEKFEGLDNDAETRKLVAATVAAGQVQKLFKHGVDTFHFYTMNRADLVFAISHLLGIRPNGAQKAA